jgi:hypothetical protein
MPKPKKQCQRKYRGRKNIPRGEPSYSENAAETRQNEMIAAWISHKIYLEVDCADYTV